MTRHILPIILICFLIAFTVEFLEVYSHAPKQSFPEFRYTMQLSNNTYPKTKYELIKNKPL